MPKIQQLRNKYELSEGKILVDKDLVIIFINQEALRVLGLDKVKVIGKNVLLYFPYSNRKTLLTQLEDMSNICRINHNYDKYLEVVEGPNYKSSFKVILKPIFTIHKHKLKGVSLNIICNQEDNKTDKSSHQHINNLSHELRAPLFNIRSFLETLYEYNNKLNPEQRLEFLEIATNETHRLNNLVKNILDFAELENQHNSDLSHSSLSNILEEILQLNQLTVASKEILLVKTISGIKDIMIADYSSHVRVISNLLNNSIKFTYPKGAINIYTKNLQSHFLKIKRQQSAGRISIIDTGVGVSKKDSRNILDRFARGNQKNHIITGSGLGLPIVKETLGKKGKKLNFSTNTKRGSSVSFNLNMIEFIKAGEGT